MDIQIGDLFKHRRFTDIYCLVEDIRKDHVFYTVLHNSAYNSGGKAYLLNTQFFHNYTKVS